MRHSASVDINLKSAGLFLKKSLSVNVMSCLVVSIFFKTLHLLYASSKKVFATPDIFILKQHRMQHSVHCIQLTRIRCWLKRCSCIEKKLVFGPCQTQSMKFLIVLVISNIRNALICEFGGGKRWRCLHYFNCMPWNLD